jgi:hypothetical protein
VDRGLCTNSSIGVFTLLLAYLFRDRGMNFDLESITEPHDFQNEELVALDTTIRCGICKDIINIPMIAPCLHSFCSMVSFHCL